MGRYERLAIELLNEIYRNSEKAHPLLPDTFEGLVEFSKENGQIGLLLDDNTRAGVFLYLYYIPGDRLEEIVRDFSRRNRVRKDTFSMEIFGYAPTSNRRLFDKWVERLKDCETVECIVERIRKYAVSERDE